MTVILAKVLLVGSGAWIFWDAGVWTAEGVDWKLTAPAFCIALACVLTAAFL